jgi:hypothetical protein
MGEHAGRLAATWARVTLALTAGLALVIAMYGLGSVQVTLAGLAAVLLDLVVARALVREWAWQARGSWWRFW